MRAHTNRIRTHEFYLMMTYIILNAISFTIGIETTLPRETDDNHEKDGLYAHPAIILSTECDLSHTGLVSLFDFATCSSRND